MLTFDIAGGQIDGARDYQEDAFLVTRIGDSSGKKGISLIIVADGMGGHAAGNVASNMAVQTFNKHLTSAYPTPAQRPLNSRLSTAKLQRAFGLHLPHWQSGVDRMLTEVLGR